MFVPRIRSVKPELFSHEALYEAELHYKLPLRLAYIALFSCCDREGRFRWQPRRLKLDMLPYDSVDIADLLDAFIESGFIKKYEHNGELYGCIPSWLRHQKCNHREGDSELPAIEDSREIKMDEVQTNKNHDVSKAVTTRKDSVVDDNATRDPRVHDGCVTREPRVVDACLIRESRVPHASRACPGGRELEGKGRGREEKEYNVASMTRRTEVYNEIENVFRHWKTVMNHPTANLDNKRKSIIGNALKFGYSSKQLCEAITGCSYTSYNMGDNERGQRYDGLHVILRDGDQIDRFLHNFQFPPRPVSDSDRRNMSNVQTLQSWMSKKLAEEN